MAKILTDQRGKPKTGFAERTHPFNVIPIHEIEQLLAPTSELDKMGQDAVPWILALAGQAEFSLAEFGGAEVSAGIEASVESNTLAQSGEYLVTDAERAREVEAELTQSWREQTNGNASITFGPLENGNAEISPLTGDITINEELLQDKYSHLIPGAVMEELQHFQQFLELDLFGKPVPQEMIPILENDVVQRILDSGFTIFEGFGR